MKYVSKEAGSDREKLPAAFIGQEQCGDRTADVLLNEGKGCCI